METPAARLYQKLSDAALALPEAQEKLCHGTPAFYVGKKLFVRLKEDGETVALYNNDRDEWIAGDPDTFFITDHYRNYPMLLVDLRRVKGTDLRTLLEAAWKMRAPKKTVAAYAAKGEKG